MSKKKTGLLIVLGAAIGAAAAGISYYLKYKSFNDELDKDFHDYEEEDSSAKEEPSKECPACDAKERTYITLDSGKCKTEETASDAAAVEEECAPADDSDAKDACAKECVPTEKEEPAPAGVSTEKEESALDEPSEEKNSPASAATVEEDTDGTGK